MVCRILVPTTRDWTHVPCTAMESWVQMPTPGPIRDLRGKWGVAFAQKGLYLEETADAAALWIRGTPL